MHEKPDVPNFGKPGKGELIVPGMVFCIEPMINLGTHRVSMDRDQWTIRTLDRKPSAHFEHQLAVTSTGTILLSTYEYIEEVLHKK
jgi:methionyl aminopeptidase